MTNDNYVALTIMGIGIFVSIVSGIASIMLSIVGWTMKRSLDANDASLKANDVSLKEINRDIGTIKIDIAEVKKDVGHHSEKQDDFCDRLSAMEYTVRTVAAGKSP